MNKSGSKQHYQVHVVPNLFVIGASKCGTTFLHEVLSMHPQIYMTKIKEPRYFTSLDYNNRDVWYRELFVKEKGKLIYGESSPTYSETIYFKDTPRRIFEHNPNSKIIYIIREPFARLTSVYKQALSTGHWENKGIYNRKMSLVFREAIFQYPPFIEGTKYWTHIQNYRNYFADDAIKVILFEDLVENTSDIMRSVFSFLGVDGNVEINFAAAEKNSGDGKTTFNPWTNRIRKHIPEKIISELPDWGKRIARNFIKMLPVPNTPPPVLSAEDKARVLEILEPEVKGVYNYLGIEGDPWQFLESVSKSGNNKCN